MAILTFAGFYRFRVHKHAHEPQRGYHPIVVTIARWDHERVKIVLTFTIARWER